MRGLGVQINSRAEVLQQAIALLYLLSRERHEKQVQTFMHYPNGGMRMLQFWKTAARPKLHAVANSNPSIPVATQAVDSSFEHYRYAMPDFQKNNETQTHEMHSVTLLQMPANDLYFV